MKTNSEQITIRISPEMKAAIRQEAKDTGVSMGIVVRWALGRWYQQQAKQAGLQAPLGMEMAGCSQLRS